MQIAVLGLILENFRRNYFAPLPKGWNCWSPNRKPWSGTIWDSFFKLPLKVDLFKENFLLVPTKLNPCHMYMFHHAKYFFTEPRIAMNFPLNCSRNEIPDCTTQYCSDSPFQSQNQFSVSKRNAETNFRLVFRYWISSLQIDSKIHNYALRKTLSFAYNSWTDHYQSHCVFHIDFLGLISFQTTWTQFMITISKELTSLRMSSVECQPTIKELLTHIEIFTFHIVLKNICFFH